MPYYFPEYYTVGEYQFLICIYDTSHIWDYESLYSSLIYVQRVNNSTNIAYLLDVGRVNLTTNISYLFDVGGDNLTNLNQLNGTISGEKYISILQMYFMDKPIENRFVDLFKNLIDINGHFPTITSRNETYMCTLPT